MKIILENKEQWEYEKANFGKQYNLVSFRIAGIEPTQFPCILIAHPSRDVGGYSIVIETVTMKDLYQMNHLDRCKRIQNEKVKK